MEAQSAKYLKDLDKARKESDKWRKRTVRNIEGVRAGYNKLVTAAGLAILTKQTVSNTSRQERALAQLRQGYITTGGVVGRSVEQMAAKAAELQNVSVFGDEQIIEAQSKLITFVDVTEEQFDRAIVAALDLSERMEKDLNSSILQLGKVLNDPARQLSALSESGIQFNETQTRMIKQLAETGDKAKAQTIILDELERQFGGSAKAARETFGGALEGLSNALGDLTEGKGGNGTGLEGARLQIEELTAALQNPELVNAVQSTIGTLAGHFATMVTLGPKLVGYIKEMTAEFKQWVFNNTGPLGSILGNAFDVDAANNATGGGDRGRSNPLITVTRGNNDHIDPTSPDFLAQIGVEQDGLDRSLEAQIEYWAERNEVAKRAAEVEQRLEREVLATKIGVASQALDLIANTAKEGSALQKAALIASKALAVAQIVINTEVAASSALLLPPIGLGPVAGVPFAKVIRTLGYTSAALTAAQAIASFDGGGFTGTGPRSGGLDGKGGFHAILHPNETVIDHTKPGGIGATIIQHNDFRGSTLNEAQVSAMIADANQALEYKIKKDLAR